MASTARRPRGSIVPATPQSQSGGSHQNLPVYQPPEFPLSSHGHRALTQLLQRHDLARMSKLHETTIALLTNDAADINDRLYQKETEGRGYQDRDEETEGQANGDLPEMRIKVDRMTERMEMGLRKMIDGEYTGQTIRTSVDNTTRHASSNASTQATAPQRTQNNDGDVELSDFDPTDPSNSTNPHLSVLDTYRKHVEDARVRYQGIALSGRYSSNNDYVHFRRMVHDAKHPDDDVPLPHQNEWFKEGRAAAPGVTLSASADTEAVDDDDDDIAISRATTSTRCPITLQEFKDPITSKTCPHSFERDVILQMIDESEVIVGGRPGPRRTVVGGQKSMRCPVPGCNETLTRDSLHMDMVIIRKIKRIQRARQLAQEDDDSRDGAGQGLRAHLIDDNDSDDATDVDALLARQTQVRRPKQEVSDALSQGID